MKTSITAARQKAVWGPKRAMVAAALLIIGLSPNAMAAERHHTRQGRKAVAGRPNSQVKNYKLDNQLTFEAANRPNRTTRVIVELKPGATLPPVAGPVRDAATASWASSTARSSICRTGC